MTEGSARLAVANELAAQPGGAAGFFNPRMRLNRELCLAEVRSALQPGAWRARPRQPGDAGADAGGSGLGAEGHPIKLLDAFAASGALAVRLALEVAPQCARPLEVTAADIDVCCCDLAALNATTLNGLRVRRMRVALDDGDDDRRDVAAIASGADPLAARFAELAAELAPATAQATGADTDHGSAPACDPQAQQMAVGAADADSRGGRGGGGGPAAELRVACADARALLLLLPPFEWAHLDPFGSCAPHLDAFAARAPHGGLLSLTATDTAALYAHYPNVALRAYAAALDRGDPNWREAGVRALCGALATAAARHGRGVEVLHAAAAAHFVHVVARVERGAAAADRATARVGRATTPDGGELGPLWLGALNEAEFVRRAAEAAAAAEVRDGVSRDDAAAAREARLLLERSLEDAPALPPFSHATGHASPPAVVAALRAQGFTAARSAYDGDASKPGSSRRVRTDAPADVVAEVVRGLVTPKSKTQREKEAGPSP